MIQYDVEDIGRLAEAEVNESTVVEPPGTRKFRTKQEVTDTFIGADYTVDSGNFAEAYFPEDQATGRKRVYIVDIAADIMHRDCSPADVAAKYGLAWGQIARAVDLIVRHKLHACLR